MANKKAKKNKKPARLKSSLKPDDKPTDAQRRVFEDIAGKAMPRSVKTKEQASEAIRQAHYDNKAKRAKQHQPEFKDNAVFLHVEKPVESDCGLGKTQRCATCGTEVHPWTDGSRRPDPSATPGNIKRLQDTIRDLRNSYESACKRADERLRDHNKLVAELRQAQSNIENLKGTLEFYINKQR